MRWHCALLLAVMVLTHHSHSLKADEEPPKKPENKTERMEVPYRLTGSNHIMVRAKINGKGPFNLIVDTGAPAVFITKKVAAKAKAEPGEKDWANLDSFELEGGLKIDKVRARVEDVTQIEGMNTLGLAGIELHGVIGYEVLARFRVDYDMTRDKLVFEPLKFDPPKVLPLPKKKDGKEVQGIDSMGPMVKMLAAMLGLKPNFEVVPRGFAGIECEEKNGKVTIKTVLPDSPAAKAGLKVGDVITSVKATAIESNKDLQSALAKAGVGTKMRFFITRGGEEEEIVVELGKGL